MSDEVPLESTLFTTWLQRCRRVTVAHMSKKGSWTIFEQICHAHSEVSEVYQALRKFEGRPRYLEEICDSVYASLTMAHVAGFSESELIGGIQHTLEKIERRVASTAQKSPERPD